MQQDNSETRLISEKFNQMIKHLQKVKIFNGKGKINAMKLSPDFDFSKMIQGLNLSSINQKMYFKKKRLEGRRKKCDRNNGFGQS